MRAHRIVEGAALGPEALHIAIEAFDTAWKIADRFDPSVHHEAREALAATIISAARQDSSDPSSLRRAALEAMGRAYPERFACAPAIRKAEGTRI